MFPSLHAAICYGQRVQYVSNLADPAFNPEESRTSRIESGQEKVSVHAIALGVFNGNLLRVAFGEGVVRG